MVHLRDLTGLSGSETQLSAEQKRAIRNALRAKEVERLVEKLRAFDSDMAASDGEYTKSAMWSALEFLECLGFVFDVNAQADMDELRSELGIDDEGYRLGADGERLTDGHRWHVPAERLAL